MPEGVALMQKDLEQGSIRCFPLRDLKNVRDLVTVIGVVRASDYFMSGSTYLVDWHRALTIKNIQERLTDQGRDMGGDILFLGKRHEDWGFSAGAATQRALVAKCNPGVTSEQLKERAYEQSLKEYYSQVVASRLRYNG